MQKKFWKNLKIFKTTNSKPRSLETFSWTQYNWTYSLANTDSLTKDIRASGCIFIIAESNF